MKTLKLGVCAALYLLLTGCATTRQSQDDWATRALDHSIQQYTLLTQQIEPGTYPRSLDEHGQLVTTGSSSWISGFYPGTLWYLYEYQRADSLRHTARRWTRELASQKHNTGTHDLGFIFSPSYGNAYRLLGEEADKEVLLTAARSLAQRFNPRVGCIKSWDFFNGPDKWEQYPVIIDNMMNLELLFEATRMSGDSTYHHMAVSHADHTLKNHVRADYSTYHVVDYDTLTGGVIKRITSQGFADESMWARGQAWSVAGFVICYRYTQDEKYLQAASRLYDRYATHENLPADGIPYWDFNDSAIPAVSRDASAAAVMACYLQELARYSKEGAARYQQQAENILRTLSSEAYLVPAGGSHGFILDHSTGHRPLNAEVDVPICYADYYYVKALTDYLAHRNKPALLTRK